MIIFVSLDVQALPVANYNNIIKKCRHRKGMVNGFAFRMKSQFQRVKYL